MKLSEVGGSSWVAYDEHHRYCSGTYGKSPTAAYREFINAGLKMPADPKMERLREWVYTRATLRELSARFGLSHPDSASDLIRRGAKRLEQSKQMTFHVNEIEEDLGLNPESDPAHTRRAKLRILIERLTSNEFQGQGRKSA